MAPFRAEADGMRIAVRLTPKAAADRIDGPTRLSDDSVVLAARVRAVPEDGRANKALEKLLAAALGVPRSAVRVVSGQQSRLKQVHVDGTAAALVDLARRLWPPS